VYRPASKLAAVAWPEQLPAEPTLTRRHNHRPGGHAVWTTSCHHSVSLQLLPQLLLHPHPSVAGVRGEQDGRLPFHPPLGLPATLRRHQIRCTASPPPMGEAGTSCLAAARQLQAAGWQLLGSCALEGDELGGGVVAVQEGQAVRGAVDLGLRQAAAALKLRPLACTCTRSRSPGSTRSAPIGQLGGRWRAEHDSECTVTRMHNDGME
jgi:hypothetical protein